MFKFMHNKISAAVESVKSMAAHWLLNAVEKDRRWAIRVLLWLGADCSGEYTRKDYCGTAEPILNFAILQNKDLALWLLDISAMRKQAHRDNNSALIIILDSINLNEMYAKFCSENQERLYKDAGIKLDKEKKLLIEIKNKLLDCKLVRENMVIDALERPYNNKHLAYLINTAIDKNCLHVNNNLALKTAIYKGNDMAVEQILANNAVKEQLKTDINNDFNDGNLLNYLMSKAPDNIYIPRLINFIKMIKQILGIVPKVTNYSAPSPTFAPMQTESQKRMPKNYGLTVSQRVEMETAKMAIDQAAMKFNG